VVKECAREVAKKLGKSEFRASNGSVEGFIRICNIVMKLACLCRHCSILFFQTSSICMKCTLPAREKKFSHTIPV
jgi:hypothetical protein